LTYRTALIGLSWIATDPSPAASDPVLGTSIPYSHAAALAAIPGIDLVAGCDIVPELRTQFLERWSHVWPNAKTYTDYAQMLTETKPDLVCIATPDFLHADPFIKSVEAGAKGIFVEKPLATSVEDATRMVEAARARKVVVNVDFTRRWMPNYVAARALIQQGRIGKLSQVVIEMGGERAMLWRNHPHAVDLMAYYAGADPEWVFAELEAGYEHYGTAYKGDGGKTTSSEPAANYYVAFRNGVRGYLTGMKDTIPGLIVTLRGNLGRIQVDEQSLSLLASEMIGSGPTAGSSVPKTETIVPAWTWAGMEGGIRDVITGLETGRPTAGSTEEAWRAAAILDGVVQSQAAGNTPFRIVRPSWAD
jgi:predicted dehydrogenase